MRPGVHNCSKQFISCLSREVPPSAGMKLEENHGGARTSVAVWLQTIFFYSSNNQIILNNLITRENSGAIVSGFTFGSGFCKMKTIFSTESHK